MSPNSDDFPCPECGLHPFDCDCCLYCALPRDECECESLDDPDDPEPSED